MRKTPWMALGLAAISASLASQAQEPVTLIGKRAAADSPVRWKVSEAIHPLLGPIQFAVQKEDLATVVGKEKILSLSYVSCQRSTGTITIELTNAPASSPAAGLGPVDLPRLVCNSPAPQGGGWVKSDLAAIWEIDKLGDALARGLSPTELRRCASIDVYQNLALPASWTRQAQPVVLQIVPYAREMDTVFARCGEPTAYGLESPPPVASARPPATAAAAAKPAPAAPPKLGPSPGPKLGSAAAPPPAPLRDGNWKAARTTSSGKTNVRAQPNLGSAIVIQLDPGALLLAQPTATDWWAVKPRPGAGSGFSGYIRQDRLQFQ